jgi:hypothetical protein
MIENDNQLEATLERICHLAKIQAGIRQTATPTQFESMSSGYLSELKKMSEEVVQYLSRQDRRSPQARAAVSRDETHAAR